MKREALTRWTVEDSAELYGIRNWGSGYFDISETGSVIVSPNGTDGNVQVDLMDVVRDIRAKGINTPMLLRFSDILASRIHALNQCFADAITDCEYKGQYRGVYPIKVNQKHQVVRDIVEAGAAYHHGLEAGSKAELIAAVASHSDPEAFIICNGYKDQEFVDLALYSLKMGIRTIIVVEMPGELPLVLERSRAINVSPMLGIRAKLAARAAGHWAKSGGDRSKFGLNASQITEMVDVLRDADMLGCLRMLHYHLGSQIPDIRRVRVGLQEACRFYVELTKEGAAMGILNIGGGLAVDYDGSSTNSHSSSNYTVAEYAADVVEIVASVMTDAGVEHPTIVSESGRCITAHHSLLIFDILHARRSEAGDPPEALPEGCSDMLERLMDTHEQLVPHNAQEMYHDAVYYRDEIRTRFLRGDISLRERALAENLFWHIIRRVSDLTQRQTYVPDELQDLEQAIADVYYGNFSLFQSIPDSWAIDQLFPIMPIHRLNEMPTRQAVLADITCDSDGRIDRFIDLHDVSHVLPLHELNGEEYLLGVFLVGSYQETLGDVHNLLGDINVVHIKVDDNGAPQYVLTAPGDTVADVLTLVEYDTTDLMNRTRQIADAALAEGKINESDLDAIITAYSDGLQGYTYFEKQ